MQLAIAQINAKIGDFKANVNKILAFSQEALDQGANIVVFPEMSLCGYLHYDSVGYTAFNHLVQESIAFLQKNIPPNIAVVFGHPQKVSTSAPDAVNVMSVIYNRKIIYQQAKSALPNYDIFDEKRYYRPASEWGFFTVAEKKFGIAICEDAWEVEGFSQEQLLNGELGIHNILKNNIDILLVCSASPYEKHKLNRRVNIMQSLCKHHKIYGVYTNAVGADDGVLFDGQSFAVNDSGAPIHISPLFMERCSIVDLYSAAPTVISPNTMYQEIVKGLQYGLSEYLHKAGFSKVVLGLSGGIDSAVVAALAAHAVGADNVHALIMPSQYTSTESMRDAKLVAHNLNIKYDVLSIEQAYRVVTAALSPIFKNAPPDITEENIQARIRGLYLMAYANKQKLLCIATGNKSEYATGYSTLYGDMVGALAVIGDIYKTEVYKVAKVINAAQETIPSAIIDKPPSAELKPNQTDQDTLPPYEILDAILQLYIEERCSLDQIVAQGYDKDVTLKIMRLVYAAEHKRKQAPPIIRVTKQVFGTGRRMLITRSFFENM